MRAAPAQDPLTDVRRLYDAWNAGDVARAAALLSRTIIWESFGATPHGLQEATLAGGSGGTWRLSAGRDRAARRRRPPRDRLQPPQRRAGRRRGATIEVWTVRDGKADHYRGYPLDEGLAVLRATTGDGKLDLACRALLAFNRGDRAAFAGFFEAEARGFAERLGGARVDDVRVLAETFEALVISAVHYAEEGEGRPLHLVIGFADEHARVVVPHATPEAALAAGAV